MSKLAPLISQLTIQTKNIGTAPLRLNWAQTQFLSTAEQQLSTTGRVRIIVLKARQLGISTITEALAFVLGFLFNRYKVLVVAHDSDSAEGLLGMTNLYWETCPWHEEYTTKHLSTSHIQWHETKSSMKVGTAGNKRTGRSKTIHFLHASEYAFWDKASDMMLGLRQAIPNVPNTGIVIESTANGLGNEFHTTWEAATNGDNEYAPLFFPWHKHPEYLATAIGLDPRQLGQLLDEEERTLRAIGCSDDRLMWRRWAIKNNCGNDIEKFHQEYPTTPEEAFISTGTNAFPFDKLKVVYEPMTGVTGYLIRDGLKVTFHPDPQGPLRVFRYPNADPSWGQYFIGADPTLTTRNDFGVGQVINRHTLEQVAVWRRRLDPASFAEEMFKLGLYYNRAWIAPEKEGPGGVVIGKLLGMFYPNIWHHAKVDKTPGKVTGDTHGWSTSLQTKQILVGYLLKTIIDNSVTIHDAITFQELTNYTQYDNGEFGPADPNSGHDDTVMALGIAVTCHYMSPPALPFGATQPESADGSADADNEMAGSLGDGISGLPWENWSNTAQDIDEEVDA